jgi:hypothetical protein
VQTQNLSSSDEVLTSTRCGGARNVARIHQKMPLLVG